MCLPTNIHTLHTCKMISVFPAFCISEISIFLQIRKNGNLKVLEIQKTEIMYVCRHACIFVCMYVYVCMEMDMK